LSERLARSATRALGVLLAFLASCSEREPERDSEPTPAAAPTATPLVPSDGVALLILGTAQDAGAPQLACRRACCERLRARGERVPVASAALVDARARRTYLLDATPDLRTQLDAPALLPHLHDGARPIDGIFLTHAHAGHYLGLAFLGRESLAADAVPLFATERLQRFLASSGPWELLVRAGHARQEALPLDGALPLTERVRIEAFAVPHRDEYSDTVGFRILGPRRRAIYLPDVDALDDALWQRLLACEVLLLDGTFWQDGELEHRDMSQVPHPRMATTLARWEALPPTQRPELWFVHLNHTNPALDPASAAARRVDAAGARIARAGDVIEL
jgi:pyrroloquinoline quinone biosynthesis protein B